MNKKPTTNETEYYCVKCKKYYASYKSYGNHMRSYHSKNKEKSKCPHCGNCFTRRDNLQQHIRLFHMGKGLTYACENCHWSFSTKYGYLKHKRNCFRSHVKEHLPQNDNNIKVSSREIVSKERECRPDLVVANYPFGQACDNKMDMISGFYCSKHSQDKKSVHNFKENNLCERHEQTYLHEAHKSWHLIKSHEEEMVNGGRCELSDESKCKHVQPDCVINKALDCTVCNITFLTEQDYNDHKPYCEEMASS